MRLVILSVAALGLLSTPAIAGTQSKLPTKAEMHKAIDDMPDFNAILDDLIKLTEDSELAERMERSGEKLKTDLETSGALEPDRNGLPDIKMTLKIFASVLAEEDISEELHETLSDLEAIMEKHISEKD